MDFAFERCDIFHLVIRKEFGPLNDYDPVLNELHPFLKEKKETSKWAGTELDGETAYVYYYSANELSKDKILKFSKSLFGWEQPILPEDLSFYKSENPWLVSIAHEQMAYILTDDQYEMDRLRKIKGLRISFEEDGE
ncbi:stage III sporulation protein AH [Bacillus coagulans]|nr:stage III sporulation protein AH [Heyndrickxia coagulans]